MTIYVVNGPNLNLLGTREPDIYGRRNYADLVATIQSAADERGVRVIIYQSNHEGDLVDKIQEAWREGADGLILNPAAYTHTSLAIADALRAVSLPAVEVHLSDVMAREPVRHISYIRDACLATVAGHGFAGYTEALDILLSHWRKKDAPAT